ncbi:hypothetical protein ACFU9Y_06780 [Streptomyces sp. NPDC057621]|uniref:hypothetical protein n=1 Tax=Streptomyces sp. NPDC057621 TaxID=3346186 RepID=UPI0036C2C0DB
MGRRPTSICAHPGPAIYFDLPTTERSLLPGARLSVSVGFGGHNVVLVFAGL